VVVYRALDANDDPEAIAAAPFLSARRGYCCRGRRGRYIKFGTDGHIDFTVGVECKDKLAFAAARLDLKSLAGKRVRVRSSIEWRTRSADHPEQIEVLPEVDAGSRLWGAR
jgi:hypothetical protein